MSWKNYYIHPRAQSLNILHPNQVSKRIFKMFGKLTIQGILTVLERKTVVNEGNYNNSKKNPTDWYKFSFLLE